MGPDTTESAAAEQVRRSRQRAGLSQRELARRSGVHQPNIAAIESGRTKPSPATVQRLLDATRERPSVLLDRHRTRMRAIIAEHGGHEPRVFGSVARGTDEIGSDIDLLVRFEQGTSIFAVVELARKLEDEVGVHVDIASDAGDHRTLAGARAEAIPL